MKSIDVKSLLIGAATLASLLLFGGCSSIDPNYDNPIVAAFETKTHKEERLAKEKVEAEKRAREAKKRQAEYEARKKREEKAKNDKLAAALRDPEISKWRSNSSGAFSVAFDIVRRFESRQAARTQSGTTLFRVKQSKNFLNAYKWLMLGALNLKENQEIEHYAMERKIKSGVTESSHRIDFNNYKNKLISLARQFNGKPWRDFCDHLIKNDLVPPKP